MLSEEREPTEEELRKLEEQGDNFDLWTDDELMALAEEDDEIEVLPEEIPFSQLGIDLNDAIDGRFADEDEIRRLVEGRE